MKLKLHIGMPKTGTTAIQKMLAASSPPPPLTYGITGVLLFCSDGVREKDLLRRYKLQESDIDSVKKTIEAEFEELESSGVSQLLFSSEFFYDVSNYPESLEKVATFFHNYFEDIEIILYLRHPVNHFPSLVAQRVTSGQSDWKGIMRVPSVLYKFDIVCDLWSKYFRLNLIDYNRVKTHLLVDFCERTDLKLPVKNDTRSVTNKSLSMKTLEALAYMNQFLPSDKPEHRREVIERLSILNVKDNTSPLTPELSRHIRKKFADNIENLEKNYLGGKTLIEL